MAPRGSAPAGAWAAGREGGASRVPRGDPEARRGRGLGEASPASWGRGQGGTAQTREAGRRWLGASAEPSGEGGLVGRRGWFIPESQEGPPRRGEARQPGGGTIGGLPRSAAIPGGSPSPLRAEGGGEAR